MNMPDKLDIATLAQATTDAVTSLALVIARVTRKKEEVAALLIRYAVALEQSGNNDAGAHLVREMARVVDGIKD